MQIKLNVHNKKDIWSLLKLIKSLLLFYLGAPLEIISNFMVAVKIVKVEMF